MRAHRGPSRRRPAFHRLVAAESCVALRRATPCAIVPVVVMEVIDTATMCTRYCAVRLRCLCLFVVACHVEVLMCYATSCVLHMGRGAFCTNDIRVVHNALCVILSLRIAGMGPRPLSPNTPKRHPSTAPGTALLRSLPRPAPPGLRRRGSGPARHLGTGGKPFFRLPQFLALGALGRRGV